MHSRFPRWVTALVTIGLVAAGCNSSGPKATSTITVSAAASLTGAFGTLGADFQTAHPAAKVTFNFGSSSTLETQIEQGAAADVFASADRATMDKLSAAGKLSGSSVVFAKNKLVIATKPGNPKHIETLADLANLGVVSLCAATVPCGNYAAQVLQAAGVTIPATKVTRGQDVKTTLAAVTTGDADAAIVYVTDALSAGTTVASVTIPDVQNAIASYPIAVLAGRGKVPAAQAFVDYVTSTAGQATLRAYGFLPPT